MLLTLPIISAILIGMLIDGSSKTSARATFLWTCLTLATIGLALNRLLSLMHALTASNIAIGWALVLAACALILLWKCKSHPHPFANAWRRHARRWPIVLRSMKGASRLAYAILIIVMLITAMLAAYSVPANYDSMTYHLPRIMQWISQQSIAPYPTQIDRQIYQHPGAEHLQLQMYLLTNSDRAMQFIQWFAFAACIAAASLITRQLGGKTPGQWLAATMAACLPMAIFQSTNTKNDLLLAAIVMMAVWQILTIRKKGITPATWLGIALTLGWILLIKGTGYVFFPIIALALLWSLLQRASFARASCAMITAACICLFFIAPHWYTNKTVFGSILGPTAESYRPHGNPLAAVTLNTARLLGSNLATPLDSANLPMQKSISAALALVGLDIDDPRSMNYGDHYFIFGKGVLSEDHAGAPLHTLLILLTVFILIWKCRGLPRAYLLLWLTGLIAFTLLISWNQWICRLQLPLAMTAIPLIAFAFCQWWPSETAVRRLMLLCFLSALPALLFNYTKSIIGPNSILTHTPQQAMFLTQPSIQVPLDQAIAQLRLRNIRHLGFAGNGNALVYPFWRALGGPPGASIQYLVITNDSAKLRNAQNPPPEWVLNEVEENASPDTSKVYDGHPYVTRWAGGNYALYQAVSP